MAVVVGGGQRLAAARLDRRQLAKRYPDSIALTVWTGTWKEEEAGCCSG